MWIINSWRFGTFTFINKTIIDEKNANDQLLCWSL
jgi:hypothetical protein